MRHPLSPFESTVLAVATCLALTLSAHAGEAHGEGGHADAKEAAAKPSLKPDLKSKVEAKSEGKAEGKSEAKAEGKGESKSESKGEAKSEAKGGDARSGVSMAELRDLIDQKIAEVRTQRAPAPVLRVQPRSPRPKPDSGLMNAVYTHGGAAGHDAQGALVPGGATAVRHGTPATGPKGQAAAGVHGADNMGHDVHWAYGGDTGPENWGQLKPEFQQCMVGKRQSPIDIRDSIAVQLDPIQFDYRPSGFRVIDNGHTVQVNVEPGNSITVQGRRYELLQFHFHRPSEERINGRQFEMVAHMVHKDAEGRLAVVAVLMDQGKGHPLVQQVWNNLPLEKNTEQPALIQMDLKALLPEQQQYYTYMGSLTTPPCSEGVLWMVMKQPASMSREQIAIFSKLYPMNARPIQSASGRLIKEGQ